MTQAGTEPEETPEHNSSRTLEVLRIGRPLLCGLRRVRVVGCWRDGQLGPDALAGVGKHRSTGHCTLGEALDLSAMLNGDRLVSGRDL